MKHTRLLAGALLAAALMAQQAGKNPAMSDADGRPKILGVAHLAVYVKDLEKTRKFYEAFMGFAEPFTLPKKDGTGVRIVFVKVNEHQYFEIFNEADRGEGQLNNISFYTDNADLMKPYLMTRAVEVVYDKGSVVKGQTANKNSNHNKLIVHLDMI